MWSRNNSARLEKLQVRIDAGLVSKHFPNVARIVIDMLYKQKGIANPIHRTINFFPGSYAYFRIACLSRECVDGGFDMSRIITSMIRNHRGASKGKLGCVESGLLPDHSHVVYEVAIQYT